MKQKLKSVNVADFAKQVSNIQEVAEIIQELEQNQALAEGTKLVYLILIIPATSASCERLSSLLKCINMECSQTEEQLSNLVFILINFVEDESRA